MTGRVYAKHTALVARSVAVLRTRADRPSSRHCFAHGSSASREQLRERAVRLASSASVTSKSAIAACARRPAIRFATLAAHAAEHPHRRPLAKRSQRILAAAHEKAARALAKKRSSGLGRDAAPSTSRPVAPAPQPQERSAPTRHARTKAATQAALRQRDRQAPLGDVVGACERAGANRIAHRPACAAATASMSIAGSPSGSSHPHSLASSLAVQRRGKRARRARSHRPRARSPSGPRRARPAARRPCRSPASGRSGRSAVRPRYRATRCRPRSGPASARQASPRPRTASVSCQAMCGFSGLPKLRLLVVPSGSRTDAGQVRGALEHRGDRARCRGRPRRAARCSRSRPRSPAQDPVPCHGHRRRASCAPCGAIASTAASACSGRRTVRDWTTESYCSNSGRREAMLAEDEQGQQQLAPRPPTRRSCGARMPALSRGFSGEERLAAPGMACPWLDWLQVIERAVVHQRPHRHAPDQLSPPRRRASGPCR